MAGLSGRNSTYQSTTHGTKANNYQGHSDPPELLSCYRYEIKHRLPVNIRIEILLSFYGNSWKGLKGVLTTKEYVTLTTMVGN